MFHVKHYRFFLFIEMDTKMFHVKHFNKKTNKISKKKEYF